MPVLSFRLKLVLAMMFVVAGVSITTLVIAERRVQAYYERNFRTQTERQIAYFLTMQETRLGDFKKTCLNVSKQVRITAAMSEQEIPPEVVYDLTDADMRLLMENMMQEVRSAGIVGRRINSLFLRFLDHEGKPIQPPDNVKNRLGFPLVKRRIEQKLAQIRGALDAPERQQAGYLALVNETNRTTGPRLATPRNPEPDKLEDGTPVLQEVIITRILDPDSQRVLGALVLGFPLAELIPQPKAETLSRNLAGEEFATGILLEDRLYANTNSISDPMAALVAREMGQRLKAAPGSRGDFECRLQNGYYRIFYRLLNRQSGFPPAYQVCLYPLEQARKDLRNLRLRILGSGGAGLLGALLLSLALSHGLVVPIRDLARGTREVQRGNYDVKVPVRTRDEVGQLTVAFNEMTEGLAQKERYRTLLNQVADERVAQQLISGKITLGGEVRQASVLFCDIRGFTALTQNMPPTEVIEMLNEHMTALTHRVKEHDGVLDKFVGDLLMAIFGAPLAHGDDVLHAARCALSLLEERERLNQTSRHKIHVGIGLATGNVVAGGMGSAERFHYTVLGERVNLASRLCHQAAAGEVLIEQTTFDLLRDQVVVEPGHALTLKGFDTPVQVYRLLGLKQ